MPIYITKSVNFATKIEAFESRGLSNQASSKVSELAIVVVSPTPIINQIRFANVSSELHGRLEGKIDVYKNIPRAVLRRVSGECPFEGPTLFVEMKTGGEVLNSMGLFEVATSKIGCYAGTPTIPHFVSITSLGIDFYQNIPAGNVNIAGYIAFISAWRGIRAFAALGMGGVGEGGALNIHTTKAAAAKVGAREEVPAVTRVGEDGKEVLVKEGRPGKEGGGVLNFIEGYFNFVNQTTESFKGIPMIGTETTDLDFGGLLFPYFPEMLDGDVDFAYHVFINLFKFCLEDGEGPTAEAIQVYRRGFRYLSNSRAGKIIQHIYLGIKLAVDSGAQLVLVRDGIEYAGFILKDDEKMVRIAVQNRVYSSLGSTDLNAELSVLNYHHSAIKGFFELMLTLERMDGAEELRTIEEITRNPRVIREMIQARRADDVKDVRREIMEMVEKMRFRQTYWEINAENINRFLESMIRNHPMHDHPMYLHSDVLFNRSSKVYEYLSVFGGQAPSIYHGSKSIRVLPPHEIDPNLAMEDNRRAVPHIPFVIKGLASAALDWATAYRNSAFRYTPMDSKRDGQGRGFSSKKARDGVIADPVFPAFYSNLREWFAQERPVVRRDPKRKRVSGTGSGDEEMEEDVAPKKKPKFVFL